MDSINARLLRTQQALETCTTHIDESSAGASQIESFLTQHVLVIMCAEMQHELYTLLENRAAAASDAELESFAVAAGKKALRSVGKNEIANFVGHFGVEAKTFFNQELDDRDVTLYNNAVAKRHEVAHGSGSNVTLRELDDILSSASKIVDAVERAISLERVES